MDARMKVATTSAPARRRLRATALGLTILLAPAALVVRAQNAPAQPAAEAAAGTAGARLAGGCSQEEFDTNADCRNAAAAAAASAADPEKRAPGKKGDSQNITGYWVAVVTEDWRWRMMTPPKGDYASLPLNDAGKKAGDAWTFSTADSCLNYGAAGLLRNPLRLHVSWENDDTLKLETDHGKQTRLLHFAGFQRSSAPTLQGDSFARWDETGLNVSTSHLAPGYLRRNGVPYSANTHLTEFFTRYSAFGDEWLTVTTVVEDPVYLSREFITSSHFKRLPDAATWNPKACTDG